MKNEFQAWPPDNHEVLVVVVRVNSDCSVGCRYCGFSRELNRSRSTIDHEVLFELGGFLQAYRTERRKNVLVSWLGGEPFQWLDWRSHTQRFVEQFGLCVSVTTNGLSLCNPSVRRDALRWFHELTISIDGEPAYHDELRRMPGMFRRLEQLLKDLVTERIGSRPKLRINSVLTRHNIADFGTFCDRMSRLGIDEISFNQLGGNDRPEFFPDNCLSPDNVRRFTEELPDIRHRLQLNGTIIAGSDAYLERILATSERRSIPVEDCEPGKRFLFVDEQGFVGPCSFTASTLGVHIRDLKAAGLDAFENLLRTKLQAISPNACRDCHATHIHEKFRELIGASYPPCRSSDDVVG